MTTIPTLLNELFHEMIEIYPEINDNMTKQKTKYFLIRSVHFIQIMLEVEVLPIGHEPIPTIHKCYYPTKMTHLKIKK